MSHVQNHSPASHPRPAAPPGRTGGPDSRPVPEPGTGNPPDNGQVGDGHVIVDGEPYLCIRNVNRMAPFLMSIVSDSDLWLFAGSNTGFTAGRRDPDHAIFPYVTADKILGQPLSGGVLTLLEVDGVRWEPWNPSTGAGEVTRNLYKHATGTSVRYEETHHGLRLRLTWSLAAGSVSGLVRTCKLENLGDGARKIRMLDGWHKLLPPGVSQETYSRYSYLAAAYMRHEFLPECGLGIHTLNSGISDRAEPCESLRVSTAWSVGHVKPVVLLSDRQVDLFRNGGEVTQEDEVRGEFGAHLVATSFTLSAGAGHEWITVADGGLDHAAVVKLRRRLMDRENLWQAVADDVASAARDLKKRIAGADALQQTADRSASVHHFANALFNCMRGGTLYDGYRFTREDLTTYLKAREKEVAARHADWLAGLPEQDTMVSLGTHAARIGDPQLTRLVREYLPLSFSRRHGDPSRPWNRFEIRIKDQNNRPVHGYSGNWRDIFQNWESMAYSFPACFEAMISVFLNATTADGYNPYRITREGIDWEVHDPKDPWSHIGYWGDHQIVYLLRLLEGMEHFHPGKLGGRLDERLYAYANVPYEIRGFDELSRDPRHSIHFNEVLHEELMARARTRGGDGKLLADPEGKVVLVPLVEKLLVPALAKLSNLVPGGGIWLNTQRPEWNDANNALAGWGLSVVTVCYLRRYFDFLGNLLADSGMSTLEISEPVARLMRELVKILPKSVGTVDDISRWKVTEALGRAGEMHRAAVYQRKPFATGRVDAAELRAFVEAGKQALDATLASNVREDGMFHSYNILQLDGKKAAVRHLDVMLEGQVAALSSGRMTGETALELLGAMRRSALYREDQKSYLLYPDRPIVPYLERNRLPADWMKRAPLMAKLAEAGDRSLGTVDETGAAHFQGDFSNARDLEQQLAVLEADPRWERDVARDRAAVLELWEEAFRHRSFTGRSGTMFAFEGLGSIYWHMVAKLLLAVQETYFSELAANPAGDVTRELGRKYYEIREGLGFTKDAKTYGAFPTDPYSHTPGHRGAQQPGMTGQVKEEILTRMGELGIRIRDGQVHFEPTLLKRSEFFSESHVFSHVAMDGSFQNWEMEAGTLAFTIFQVPVCYVIGKKPAITVEWNNGTRATYGESALPRNESRELFRRNDAIRRLVVTVSENQLLSR